MNSNKNMLNICQVVNNLDAGGLEKIAISLHNGIENSEINSFLICLDGPGSLYPQVEKNTSNHLILEKPSHSLLSKFPILNLLKFRRFITSNKINVIHAHNWAALIYSVTATKGLSRKPKIVFSEHNQINRATTKEKAKFLTFLQKANSRLMVSKNLQDIYIDTYGKKLTTDVMYNGIDGKRFNVETIGTPSKSDFIPVNNDDFVIGTAVVLSEQKGLKYFIEAAAKVCAITTDVKFVIAGDGPLRKELESQAKKLNLDDRLFFIGFQTNIPKIVSCYDVYLMTSLWEGLPLSLIEALALGKPVVATNVGGNSEVVQDNENGFIVPSKDINAIANHLIELYNNRTALSHYKKINTHRFTKTFSLDKMLKNHTSLYKSL
jgi:glycosyltransferase involved in cell wall biosynthesis